MYQTLRSAAIRGIEGQKLTLTGRLRNAAARARDVSQQDHQQGAVREVTHWLAAKIDSAADAIESRNIEDALTELRDLARRHPVGTLAAVAAMSFLATRLAMPVTAGAGAPQGNGGRVHA